MLFAALACVFAAAVLFTSNIVRMAFYLTLSLGATSGLFFLAGAHFVGAMQLMIYVGGTLVLLIFGVMLTAQARFISLRTSSGEWIAALIVGSLLLVLLIGAAFSVEPWRVVQPASATRSGRSTFHDCSWGRIDRGPRRQAQRNGCHHTWRHVRLPAAVRYRVGSPAGGVDRRRVHGKSKTLPKPTTIRRRCRRACWVIAEQQPRHGDVSDIGTNLRFPLPGRGRFLFVTGLVCMVTKRNALGVLMGIELVLNGANINFVAFGSQYLRDRSLGPGRPVNRLIRDRACRGRGRSGLGDCVEFLQQPHHD